MARPAAPPLLLLLLALLSLLAAAARAQTCDGITECLQEGETDCRQPGHRCAAGLYCFDDVTTPPPRIGTCRRSALLGEACNNQRTAPGLIRCWDPQYAAAIICADEALDANGTCVYSSLYAPSEACSLSSQYDEFGGCFVGACVGGKCTTLVEGDSCTATGSTGPLCGPGLFCNATLSACERRKPAGAACSASVECDYSLICTAKGQTLPHCAPLFAGTLGDGCDTSDDCGVGLYCNSRAQCAEPSAFSDNLCTGNGDCQPGWECECVAELEGNFRVETGGRCTKSLANTADRVDGLRDVQACLKRRGCQDWWWRRDYASGSQAQGPNQCFAACIAETGTRAFDFPAYKEGQCFAGDVTSDGGALAAHSVVLAGALLALLFTLA